MTDAPGNTEHDIQWALDLLTREPDYEENLLGKYWPYIIVPTIAAGGCGFANYFQGKPIWASFPRYAASITVAFGIAKFLEVTKFNREARRDAMLKHYIKLHPEDFPRPERKKWADHIEEWVPLGR